MISTHLEPHLKDSFLQMRKHSTINSLILEFRPFKCWTVEMPSDFLLFVAHIKQDLANWHTILRHSAGCCYCMDTMGICQWITEYNMKLFTLTRGVTIMLTVRLTEPERTFQSDLTNDLTMLSLHWYRRVLNNQQQKKSYSVQCEIPTCLNTVKCSFTTWKKSLSKRTWLSATQ